MSSRNQAELQKERVKKARYAGGREDAAKSKGLLYHESDLAGLRDVCYTPGRRRRLRTARRGRHDLNSGGWHVAAKRRPGEIPNQPKAKTATPATCPCAADGPVRTSGGRSRDSHTRPRREAATGVMARRRCQPRLFAAFSTTR